MKLSALRSIGEKREKSFHKLGIYDVEDLVRFYPRAYLDLTERASIKYAYHNDMILVACEVNRVNAVQYGSNRKMVKAFCSQDGFPFTVVWFNQPYVAQKLQAGEYLFYGRVQNKFGQVSLVNPTFEPLEQNYRLKGIVPVYSLKGSLSQKIVRAAVKEALQKVDLTGVIPWQIIKKYNLPSLEKALDKLENIAENKIKNNNLTPCSTGKVTDVKSHPATSFKISTRPPASPLTIRFKSSSKVIGKLSGNKRSTVF